MTDPVLREARHPDGRRFSNYVTQEVRLGETFVGAIQCVEPCFDFEGRALHRHHGPWIAFKGSDIDGSRNLPGRHDDEDQAVAAVLRANGVDA